jgi:hypothetical protein
VTGDVIYAEASRDPAYDSDLSKPFHYLSHTELLCSPRMSGRTPPALPSGSAVEAIIVPTIRDASHLRSAVDLATQLGCPLIIIYSRRSPDELANIHSKLTNGKLIVIGLPADLPRHLEELLASGADAHPRGASEGPLDISRKRNLGLLLAKLCGWTRILFLDDDIRDLGPEQVDQALSLLPEYPVVGFQVRDYPDNSVVSHAKRLAGWQQDVFISGGSLFVDPQHLNGFFPPIYHEDWFCSLNHICAGTAAVAGVVRQLAWNPFATPRRARLEEFADILGEGLLWLVHHKRDLSFPQESFWAEATDRSFWRSTLRHRAVLLDEVERRLLGQGPQDGYTAAALVSVKEAQSERSELTPEDFASFVRQWLRDSAKWQDRLAELPRVGSIAGALAKLGLSRSTFADISEPGELSATALTPTRRPGRRLAVHLTTMVGRS